MSVLFVQSLPPLVQKRPLTEDDAVDIWIARWLRVGPKELTRRYGCYPRRLYEIWEGAKFPNSRERAWKRFERRFRASSSERILTGTARFRERPGPTNCLCSTDHQTGRKPATLINFLL